MSEAFVLFGGGPMAADVHAWAQAAYPAARLVGIVDHLAPIHVVRRHLPVAPLFRSIADARASIGTEFKVLLGVADCEARRKLATECNASGARLLAVVHPAAHIGAAAHIEEGVIIGPRAVVVRNASIAAGTIVQYGSLIGHDTRVGAWCFLGPGSNIAGRVRLGDASYIGMAAAVRDGVTVGSGATVGMGAVVVKDVLAHSVVMGVPARQRSSAGQA